jgi:hypothetical protein
MEGGAPPGTGALLVNYASDDEDEDEEGEKWEMASEKGGSEGAPSAPLPLPSTSVPPESASVVPDSAVAGGNRACNNRCAFAPLRPRFEHLGWHGAQD